MDRENNNFFEGLRDGVPICLGYLSVSFAFGIFAVGTLKMSVLEAVLISMLNVTSAGQLAGAPIIASFGSLWELASTQVIINLRYSLMSVSLSQRLGKSVRLVDRFWIAFCNTDEIFAVSSGKADPVGRKYMLGLILTPYLGWSIGTLIGAAAGNILPPLVVSALGVAIYGMFIAIVVPVMKKELAVTLCVLVAMLLSVICYYVPFVSKIIPSELHIVLCAVIASVALAIFKPIKDEDVVSGDNAEEVER